MNPQFSISTIRSTKESRFIELYLLSTAKWERPSHDIIVSIISGFNSVSGHELNTKIYSIPLITIDINTLGQPSAFVRHPEWPVRLRNTVTEWRSVCGWRVYAEHANAKKIVLCCYFVAICRHVLSQKVTKSPAAAPNGSGARHKGDTAGINV